MGLGFGNSSSKKSSGGAKKAGDKKGGSAASTTKKGDAGSKASNSTKGGAAAKGGAKKGGDKKAPAAGKKAVDQAGGHEGAFEANDDGTLIKKCNKGEWEFYKNLKKYPKLKPFCPKLVKVIGKASDEQHQVQMGDLTQGYKKPCIMCVVAPPPIPSHFLLVMFFLSRHFPLPPLLRD